MTFHENAYLADYYTVGLWQALDCALRVWWVDFSSPVKDGGVFNLIFLENVFIVLFDYKINKCRQ